MKKEGVPLRNVRFITGLALVAISLFGIGNVHAEAEIDTSEAQETSSSLNETDTQSSIEPTEPKITTDSSESDERMDGTSLSDAETDNSEETSEILKKARSIETFASSSEVTVSTEANFKSAWEDPAITKINLSGNIDIYSNLAKRTSNVEVVGNNFTIKLLSNTWQGTKAQFSISDNIEVSFNSISITNVSSSVFVPGSGIAPITGGSINVINNVSVTSNASDATILISNRLAIFEQASLTINSSNGVGITGKSGFENLESKSNSKLVINANGNGIQKINNLLFGESSTTTITPSSSGTGISFSQSNTMLSLSKSAVLNVTTGDYGIANTSTTPSGSLVLSDQAYLGVVATGAGIVGFNQVDIGSIDGVGATLDVTAKGRVGLSAPNSSTSNLIVNNGSKFSVYGTGSSSSYSAIKDFSNITLHNSTSTVSSSNSNAIQNIEKLSIDRNTIATFSSKLASLSSVQNVTIKGESTQVAIKSDSSNGIETGNSLVMEDSSSMTISSPTVGIKGIASVSIMNTSILSNGTYNPTVIGQSWANLDYGISGATDVVLNGNVTIGSGNGQEYDRKTSPKRGAIVSKNSVLLAGNNNIIYGGGFESSADSLGSAIVSTSIEVSGANNIISAYQSTNPSTINAWTGINNSTALHGQSSVVVSGNANTLIGKGYSIYANSTQDSSVVLISGNENQLVPKSNTSGSSNSIDTNVSKVEITGNQNNLTAIDNGILNWRTTPSTINVSGNGNNITATYNKDDNTDKGVAINISGSTEATISISGNSNSTQNVVSGYRYGIKASKSYAAGGTINLSGSSLIKSNSDMTAISRTVNFLSGNIEMNYIGRVDENEAATEIASKKSVLWAGTNDDLAGSSVNVQAGANVYLNGWGYMDKANPTVDKNNISSPIHSSYEYINVEDGGMLSIESKGNAINWFRDRGSSSTMNRGFAQYVVKNGGTLKLKSTSTNADVSVVQKLNSEPSTGKGNVEIQNGGSFIAEGSGGYVFDLPVGTNFSITNPRVLDLKNTSHRPVFSKQASSTSKQTVFSLNKTNISLWTLDTDLSSTENSPDFAYDDVGFADITATGTALLLSTDQSKFVTDFKAADSMSTISRIRAEIKGLTQVYYQVMDDTSTKTEFSTIGNANPLIRYPYGTTINTILSTKIQETGAKEPHFRYQELTAGVSDIRPLINKYNIATSLPENGVQQYYKDFKGKTWDEESIEAFESWTAAYSQSNDAEGNPVYDDPVLKLKKIPFSTTISETGLSSEPILTTLTGEYGDEESTIILGKVGYSAEVKINGSIPISLGIGETVALPVVYNFDDMNLSEDNKFKSVWNWIDTAETDSSISRSGTLSIEITYTKGPDVFAITSAPSINFGIKEIYSPKITANELDNDLIVVDTAEVKKSSWKIQTQLQAKNIDTSSDLVGSYFVIDGKIINDSVSTFIEKVNDSGPIIDGENYTLFSKVDSQKVELIIPERNSVMPNKNYEYTLTWTLSETP